MQNHKRQLPDHVNLAFCVDKAKQRVGHWVLHSVHAGGFFAFLIWQEATLFAAGLDVKMLLTSPAFSSHHNTGCLKQIDSANDKVQCSFQPAAPA